MTRPLSAYRRNWYDSGLSFLGFSSMPHQIPSVGLTRGFCTELDMITLPDRGEARVGLGGCVGEPGVVPLHVEPDMQPALRGAARMAVEARANRSTWWVKAHDSSIVR